MTNENGQTGGPAIVQTSNVGDNYALDLIPAYAIQHAEILREYRDKLQFFTARANSNPTPESIDNTPDNKAKTILISHIETTLDELFFGLWETTDFKWAVIANEVVGSIVLEVTHPVTGKPIRRTGAACIQIMMDKVPEDFNPQQGDTQAEIMEKKRKKNLWQSNPENKKPSALDMGFPKLKAECLKNAAQSLGKLFGRDLNRGAKADIYKPLQKKAADATKATENLLNSKS